MDQRQGHPTLGSDAPLGVGADSTRRRLRQTSPDQPRPAAHARRPDRAAGARRRLRQRLPQPDLAGRGATVVGVEPGPSLFDFAIEQESIAPRGIRYVHADLCDLPDLGGPFDAVVASMVLPAIPDWTGAMRACVHALKPGGLFLFTVNHPCYEQLRPTWREHGEYRTHRYLTEHEIPGPNGVDFHRTLSTYLNQLTSLGCQLTELAEPGLDPDAAVDGPDGIDAYVHLPNFLIVAAQRTT
ncbi:class I SAM-dependent methyltransferase [Plantactinospora sp. CA-294935]|uniref:class I SAM-dependent methyltransferase n=1 Tax=Plantactinospora sp. CA-294935 TaxID=3240012 RepID=UPI003D928DCC